MALYLVRHGKTKWNESAGAGGSQDKIRGWTDLPLDAEGIQDAHRIADKLEHSGIVHIITSPLQRARMTAMAISKRTQAPVDATGGLLPWHLGDMTGQPVKKVLKEMQHYQDHEAESVPGGEPFAQFRKRGLSTMSKLLADSEDKNVAAVTHTRMMQLVKAWIAGGAKPDFSVNERVMNDYSGEVAPGHVLVLRKGEGAGRPTLEQV